MDNKIKSIVYIIPYFGKLPQNINLVLQTMRYNPSINWIIFTDDHSNLDYPSNVDVHYIAFDEFRQYVKRHYNFEIKLENPWDLCKFKVAYGELFYDLIKDYDFWGYCDLDLMFGNLRNFFTEDILTNYVKIGYQGHSTIFLNNPTINSVYKNKVLGTKTYIEAFQDDKGFCFDENEITKIFEAKGYKQYTKTNFAHLGKFNFGFYLRHMPKNEQYKNDHQIFIWEKGTLTRYYAYEKKVYSEEFMYIHFWCRPMSYTNEISDKYIIYADSIKKFDGDVNLKIIKKYSKNNKILFYIRMFKKNYHKITLKKIFQNIKYKKIQKNTDFVN